MSSETLGNKHRAQTPDVPNTPDPTRRIPAAQMNTLECYKKTDVHREDYCGEEESEVGNALETGGKEGKGVTRGQESRV
jgi:hypothetical protein